MPQMFAGYSDEILNKQFDDLSEKTRIQGSEQLANTPTLTFGERLVGLSFNPSKDSKVDQAKRLFAQAADLIHDDHKGEGATDLYDELYHHTIGEILNAQMNVVKLLTLKY